MQIQITPEALFGSAAVRVRAVSDGKFTLELSGSPAWLHSGRSVGREPFRIQSTAKDPYEAEFIVRGWLVAMPTLVDEEVARSVGNKSALRSGERWWPFTAARLVGDIHVVDGAPISYVDLNLPAEWRLRNFEPVLTTFGNSRARRSTYRLGAASNSLYEPKDGRPERVMQLDASLQSGANALAGLITVPALGWLVTLAALAIAAKTIPPQYVIATGTAALLLGLRRWAGSERPHHLNLLGSFYSVAALATVTVDGALGSRRRLVVVGRRISSSSAKHRRRGVGGRDVRVGRRTAELASCSSQAGCSVVGPGSGG
jgi:hypothetical protein